MLSRKPPDGGTVTPLTHDQQHDASLTHEQRSEVRQEARKTALLWALVPLVMATLSLSLVVKEQLDTSHQIERDGVRSEYNALDHSIKHEECDVSVLRQVVRQRINERTDIPVDVCEANPHLEDMKDRRDLLDARLREMGAYEPRDE